MAVYNTAITTAQAVAADADATQAEVDNAVTALATATGIFNIAKAGGIRVLVSAITVTGTAQVGVTLTGTVAPTGATVTYKWQISNTAVGGYADIASATENTYTPVAGDAGKYIHVVATGTGSYTGTVTSAATGATAAAPVAITTAAIAGVTAPVTGATPVSTITDTTEYAATITWNGTPSTFAASTAYTATITITPKTGYTLTGVAANFFTVAGATATNSINSGVVAAVFSETVSMQLTIATPSLTTSKTYNGDTIAAVTAGALSGVIGGDTVTVSAVATYDTATVGTGKTITVAYTLSGASTGNYTKPVNYSVATGVISAVQLTIATPSLTTSKTYNGDTTAAVTAGALSGVIGGDTVTVSAVATYDTATVGTGKTITVAYTLSGASTGNYTKPVNYSVATGVISAVQLTIANPTLTATKAYDGTTAAAVTAEALTGVVSGDNVTVTAVATYDTATVGTGKTITVVYTLSGASAGNYTKPVNYSVATGVISAVQLTIANPTLTATKAYNGTTAAAVTAGIFSGIISGDTVTVTAVATYDTATTGTGKTITVVYTLSGASAGNYTNPVNYSVATGAITTATITAIGAINGTAQVSVVLTTGTITPSGATVSYQWQISADGTTYAAIAGATATTYTPIAGDVNKLIKVVATGIGNYSGTVTSSATSAVVAAFAIGDSYQGGKIAYIDGTGQHGLIAAPSDQSIEIVWYNGSYTVTGATATAFGTGNANTNTIVASQGTGSYAAQLCADLELNGYNDWYLPSKDELNKLYLKKAALGVFASNYYWSSSEISNTNAWCQNFAGGSTRTTTPLRPTRSVCVLFGLFNLSI